MHHSGRNNPCPVCQRVKDADCRWSGEIMLCHTGTDLRPGSTITIEGQIWAFIRHNAGYSGGDALFRPHREGVRSNAAPRSQDLEAKAKRSTVSFQVSAFLDHFQQCWDIRDLHSLQPADLTEAVLLIERTAAEGLALSRSLAPIWRQYPDLADSFRWRIDACNKSLKHQQQDTAHFRSHYLGEVIA